jgi:uncharacterized protein (DUF1015 family)
MNSDEARAMAADNPHSFLHVDKAEIDLPPGTDPYDATVYEKARENYANLQSNGILKQDEESHFYIYRLTMDGRAQTGIVGCPSADDYIEGRIKKHELTRADKEADRIRHVDALNANTGPIFLTHRPDAALEQIKSDWTAKHAPLYDFMSVEGVRNEAWIVDDARVIANLAQILAGMDALYIADGHHRCASAIRVARMRREANPGYTGDEEFNYFLAVLFSSDELRILDYNRVVRDLNGLDGDAFLARVGERFDITTADSPVRPEHPHVFGMYLKNRWYRLTARPLTWKDTDPVARLDVSILQDNLLSPILGVEDPRTNARIDFIGGIRGVEELEKRVHADMAVAFSLHPTSVDELMDIADAGQVMPPKSTWFEPKLLSGLFVHAL